MRSDKAIQKNALRGLTFDEGEARLRPEPEAPKSHAPVQRTLTVGGEAYERPSTKTTLELKKLLKTKHLDRGWKADLNRMIKSGEVNAFDTVEQLVDKLRSLREPKKGADSSPEAVRLKQLFEKSGLSIAGFLWKACSVGFKLEDSSTFGREQVVAAMMTKAGREFVDGKWRDDSKKENEKKRESLKDDDITDKELEGVGEGRSEDLRKTLGQHEWILTSDLVYVLKHAKTEEDIAFWFSAAEMLRTPTKHVVFHFELGGKDLERMNKGKVDTLSELGVVNAHAGGIYAPRSKEDRERRKDSKSKKSRKTKAAPTKTSPTKKRKGGDKKDTSEDDQYNVQVCSQSPAFHKELSQLLRKFLSETKNDHKGYLKALEEFQERWVWDGEIGGLDEKVAKTKKPGFMTGAKKDAPEVSSTIEGFQKLQSERYTIDRGVMKNRVNALRFQIKQAKVKRDDDRIEVDYSKRSRVSDEDKPFLDDTLTMLDDEFEETSKSLKLKYDTLVSVNPLVAKALHRDEWDKRYNEWIESKKSLLDVWSK